MSVCYCPMRTDCVGLHEVWTQQRWIFASFWRTAQFRPNICYEPKWSYTKLCETEEVKGALAKRVWGQTAHFWTLLDPEFMNKILDVCAVVMALGCNSMKIFKRFSHWTQRDTHTHTWARAHARARKHAHTHTHHMLRTLFKRTQNRHCMTSVDQISLYGICQKCWDTKCIHTTYIFDIDIM